MRPRWPEWVIIISLIVIGLTGLVTIWGGDIRLVLIDVSRGEAQGQDQGAASQPGEAAPQPPPALPGGVPSGPF